MILYNVIKGKTQSVELCIQFKIHSKTSKKACLNTLYPHIRPKLSNQNIA